MRTLFELLKHGLFRIVAGATAKQETLCKGAMIERAEDVLVCCEAIQGEGRIELFVKRFVAGRTLTLAHKLVDVTGDHLRRFVAALFEAVRKGILQRILEVFGDGSRRYGG